MRPIEKFIRAFEKRFEQKYSPFQEWVRHSSAALLKPHCSHAIGDFRSSI